MQTITTRLAGLLLALALVPTAMADTATKGSSHDAPVRWAQAGAPGSMPGPTMPSRVSPGFRNGPPSCAVDAYTKVNLGQVHQWCPGVQTAGGGCSSPMLCKRCDAPDTWSADYRC